MATLHSCFLPDFAWFTTRQKSLNLLHLRSRLVFAYPHVYSYIARITTHLFVVLSSALVTLVRLHALRPAHAFPDVEVQSRPFTIKGTVMWPPVYPAARRLRSVVIRASPALAAWCIASFSCLQWLLMTACAFSAFTQLGSTAGIEARADRSDWRYVVRNSASSHYGLRWPFLASFNPSTGASGHSTHSSHITPKWSLLFSSRCRVETHHSLLLYIACGLWATYYVHCTRTDIYILINYCYFIRLCRFSPAEIAETMAEIRFPCFSPSCGRNTFLPGRKPTLLWRNLPLLSLFKCSVYGLSFRVNCCI